MGYKMTNYNWTGYVFSGAMLYALICVLGNNITFNWKLAGGAILFIFTIETVGNIVIFLTREKKQKIATIEKDAEWH
jgi:hypothetical protein